jgi:hypothetical protein
MNLKKLLFGRLSKFATPKTVKNPEVAGWVSFVKTLYNLKIPIMIVLILIAFLAGFFCWGCLVLCKRRRRQQRMALNTNHEINLHHQDSFDASEEGEHFFDTTITNPFATDQQRLPGVSMAQVLVNAQN